MSLFKKLFTGATGYWIHKKSTLPVGTDIFVDIHERLHCKPFKVVFDVGANIGQTWEWVRANEPSSKIYCFEPVSGPFAELKKLVGNDSNTVLEHLALGEAKGQKTIRLFDENSSLNSLKDDVMNNTGYSKEEIVTIDTLDSYCKKNNISKIDFLKIDTEGYELNVLEGAGEMLSSESISFIYCETGFLRQNNRNTYFADLTEWLEARGYHFFGIYQLVSNGWRKDFGNALFVPKSVAKR